MPLIAASTLALLVGDPTDSVTSKPMDPPTVRRSTNDLPDFTVVAFPHQTRINFIQPPKQPAAVEPPAWQKLKVLYSDLAFIQDIRQSILTPALPGHPAHDPLSAWRGLNLLQAAFPGLTGMRISNQVAIELVSTSNGGPMHLTQLESLRGWVAIQLHSNKAQALPCMNSLRDKLVDVLTDPKVDSRHFNILKDTALLFPETAVPLASQLLASEDSEQRARGARIVSQTTNFPKDDPGVSDIRRRLIEILRTDEHPVSRATYVFALASLPRTGETYEALTLGVQDPDPKVRAISISSGAVTDPPENYARAILTGMSDPDRNVRSEAVHFALSTYRPKSASMEQERRDALAKRLREEVDPNLFDVIENTLKNPSNKVPGAQAILEKANSSEPERDSTPQAVFFGLLVGGVATWLGIRFFRGRKSQKQAERQI